jgi:hypothetical protein
MNAGNPMRLQHILVSMPTAARIEPREQLGLQLGAVAGRLIDFAG